MPFIVLYLLKLSISLSVAWLFYRLVLRALTFYDLNRWYLLGYSLLSFLIPFIDIGSIIVDNDPARQPLYIQYIPSIGNYTATNAYPISQTSGWHPWNIGLPFITVGMALLLTRALVRWLSLVSIRKQARLISDSAIRIYQVDRKITPFSFGNAIYINQRLHSEKEWEEIILHEYVHIRQRHTIDILLGELISILNWYNPFAWAIRHSIRQNLEFIADQKVLDNGFDKKEYQYLLLKVVGNSGYRLANNFNFSSLKKRIIMMNKIRSARLHLFKFLFVLPLLAVLLVAFRDRYSALWHRPAGPVYINAAGVVIDLHGKAPLAGVTVRDRGTGLQTLSDAKGFYKLSIPASNDSVRIHLDYSKAGYETGMAESFFPSVKATRGLINVTILRMPSYKELHQAIPYWYPCPNDPGYTDVLPALTDQLNWNSGYAEYTSLKKAHPGRVIAAPAQVDTLPQKQDSGRDLKLLVHIDSSAAKMDLHKALWIVDGVVKDNWSKDSIRSEDIASMDIIKDDEAFRLFGEKGANGVVAILTLNYVGTHEPPPAAKAMGLGSTEPVFVLDGIRLPEGVNWAALIKPDSIASINILKNSAATAQYGPNAAKRGVVLISTKMQKNP